MLYDDTHGNPSAEARGAAEGLNISADILTLGLKPLIGKLIANAKRREYYQNQGDFICAERFKRIFIAELATSLDVNGLTFARRGRLGKIKPAELLQALPERERAAFYTQSSLTGIRKEILLELKQGKGAINDNDNIIYLKPTEKPNEFVTHHSNTINPERLERRVIVDENDLSWRYAEHFDSSSLNVEISEGKRQIKLHGDNYELQKNSAGQYEIVVRKESGIKEYLPVYMEPLSRTWHLAVHNQHSVFSNSQQKIISKIRVIKQVKLDAYYHLQNNNPSYYGLGKIIKVESGNIKGDFIEMGGEYIPVRNTQHQGRGALYEVYDLNNPAKKGYPIEWDGERWLFERDTSVHVSKDLEGSIDPKTFLEKAEPGQLSAPDHQGLRYDKDDNKYIKIKGEYLKLEQRKALPFLRKNNGDRVYVEYINNQFIAKKINEATPYIIGKGSISTVYDTGDGFVEKLYNGMIDKVYKSRLISANNNAKGFNRYYGKGAATVSVTPVSEGRATVTAKLKKVEGCVLNDSQKLANNQLAKEIAAVIESTNPVEYLSNLLQEKGIVHHDINKGNIIYNNGEFFVVDFDSAVILPEGERVSHSQTMTMRDKFSYVFDNVLRDIKGNLSHS